MSFWELFFLCLIWVPLIILWTAAVLDIFRRADIGGVHKAIWILVVLVLPVIGPLAYLIIRPPGTTAREAAEAAEARGELAHTQQQPGTAQDLAVLADLHDRGKLTDEEYNAGKAKHLGVSTDLRPASVREQRGGQLL